ncbi:LOW QUALITY PROTEIN: uncharacterized protein LOC144660326 [Oculina patagonica]
MDSVAASSGRVLSSKPRAPPPPQKVIKCDPVDAEIQEDDIPRTLSTAHRKALLKQSKDQAKEPQALVFRKLDDQEQVQGGASQSKNVKVSLAHSGENLLATFYGMLYTNDGAEKDWKLEVDSFIPVCFVQVQGNANKPFRIIAVEKSRRIMEYQVNVNTTCARNKTFVKWQDGMSMFGVRFAKEDQAEQFLSTVKRMASTLNKTALLMKQPERKAMIRKMSDPDSSSNIQYTKVSLMIKLPDKQSTIMSVPGLLTMSELFDMICEKENLNPAEHQLSLPRTGTRKVTFDSGTAIGSLKIREVAIIRTMTSDSSTGSIEVEDDSVENLLDIEGEENKILQLILPSGAKKSYRVSLDMTMKQLVMRVCSRESLNPRHHSLQYIDFKHEFLEAGTTVDEIGVSQVRLMDKRVLKRNSVTSIKSDDLPSNSPHNRHHRKSCGDELESDSSGASEGDKENKMSWQQRSKSLDVLADQPQHDGRVAKKDSHTHSASNGSVPTTERRNSDEANTIKKPERRNSSEATAIKKPPVPPLPYASKPGNLSNGGLRDQGLSPIKKNAMMSASTPNLSTASSQSDDSPDIKTSTPDTKRKRRAAPPPPPRPAAPKALFTEVKSDAQVNGAGLPVKNSNSLPPVAGSNVSQVPAASEVKLKPSQKKRPAPPRPNRPPPPQPAPRVPKQGSVENKDVNGTGREKEISVQFKQDTEATSVDRAALSLDLDTRPHSDSLEEVFDEDGMSDLRGIPIFIPPPPPDDLPPPLDECETPVGPLTDFEADILEGSGSDDFPVTVNGYVGMQNIGMYAGRGVSDSQAQTVIKSRQEPSLETVLEQGSIPAEKDSFPLVPPPPLYSEPESSGLTDIPPPLLETQTIQTSQEVKEKDHDSGFDQSPEHLIVTPPADPSHDVPEGRWEDPDTGSSLDVISAIPPPADFETRPLTPPCQFANATVAPPVGFFNSEDGKIEEEPEKEQPRKKLNISENLFPWMNEPQAPVNAAIPLEKPSEDTESDAMITRINIEETPPVSGNPTETTIATKVFSNPVPREVETWRVDNPTRPELNIKQNIIPGNPKVNAKAVVSEVPRVEAKPSVELQHNSSSDQNKESVSLQKEDITKSNEIGTNNVIVMSQNSKNNEQTRSQHVVDTTAKPVKSETNAKPVVMETEVKVEAEVDVQQYAPPSFTPSTQAVRPEPHVKPAKPDLQVKPAKPEAKAKPVAVVREAEVKVEPLPPSSFNPPVRYEPAPARVEQQVKPEKPDTIAKSVTVIKEAEVNVDIQQPRPSEVAAPQPQVEVAKPKQQVKPEKPETSVKPVPLVQEAEVKVEAYVQPPVFSFNPSTEAAKPIPQVKPAKPDLQVKPEKPETNVKPVTIVKEVEVKVDVQQVGPSSFNPTAVRPEPEIQPAKPEQVQPEISEKCNMQPVDEVVTPQAKPKPELCMKIPQEEQQDLPDGSFKKTYDKVISLEAPTGTDAPVQETVIAIINVGKEDIVAEAPVTPETKPTSGADDKLKDLEARLQELDNEPVTSSSDLNKLHAKTAPAVYKEEKPAIQTKDPFSEDVIVAATKQVEFSSYEQFEALLKMDTEETPSKEVARVQHKESQQFQPESSTSHVEANPELSLDLSSLRRSPEPPRPPSSSPPAVSPRASSLPSPVALDSARSTDSGFATLEKQKNPSSPDSKPSGPSSFNTSVDKTAASVEQKESKPAVTNFIQTASEPVKPRTAHRPPNVSLKLQRPLSMPAGILREFKSDVQEKSKSAEVDSRKSDAAPEKNTTVKSDSRASTSSESSGISSPSPASSPVELTTTETVDMPKPPPFTVPPLRRYSDLAADLSFISSAAKAAEKANDAESKAEVPPKPPNLLLRRTSATAAAVERPKSWVGPETGTKQGPRTWSSAFKPVSFDAQGKKGVRPVDFQVKSFNAPPTAPKPSASSARDVNSTASVHSEAPVSGTFGAKQPDNSTHKEVVTPSNPAPSVFAKPSGITAGKSAAPAVSLLPRNEEPSSHQPVKADPSSKVDNSTDREVVKPSIPAPSVIAKPSVITAGKSAAPAVSLLPRDEQSSSHQPLKADSSSKVERTLSNPLTKETDPGKTKYEIIYSDKSPTSQGALKAPTDKTDSGSHNFSKQSANAAALRDQILRDQTRPQNKVTRSRPQSAFVSGSKFQILSADEKSQSNTPVADNKKTATVPPKGPSWKLALKQHTADHSSSKPDVPSTQPAAKPQPQVKPAVAESKPLPAVVMRTKTEQQDPAKRHSLPTYVIEGADGKQPVKTTTSKDGNFNFIVEEVQRDTTVVPQGVVAAMKALREKKKREAEGVKEGVLDLEHTQWI